MRAESKETCTVQFRHLIYTHILYHIRKSKTQVQAFDPLIILQAGKSLKVHRPRYQSVSPLLRPLLTSPYLQTNLSITSRNPPTPANKGKHHPLLEKSQIKIQALHQRICRGENIAVWLERQLWSRLATNYCNSRPEY